MTAKKFSIFGDSISTLQGYIPEDWRCYYEGAEADETGVHTYEDTWWGQVIDHFNGELLASAAYSGSMVEGAGFPAGASPERIAALAGGASKTGETNRANMTPGVSPDVIFVFMGINDYGWGSAATQALGESVAAPHATARHLGFDVYGRSWLSEELPSAEVRAQLRKAFEVEAAAPAEVRLQRFACAYDAMLAAMRLAYPQSEIWCCTLVPGRLRGRSVSTHTYNLRGIPFDAYNEVIREAAMRNGAHVADIAAFGQDYEASDGTHPTAWGMRQLSAMVVAAMEGQPLQPDPAWESTNPCITPDRSCENCPHAEISRQRWSCVCGLV